MKPNEKWKLFDQFGELAIQDPTAEITDVYNQFIRMIDADDVAFVSSHFALFLRNGMAWRSFQVMR